MRERIVLGGSIAQKPGQGGHTWVLLQYILGLKRLGWDVLFVDQLEAGMCTDSDGRPCNVMDSENLRYFLAVMNAFDLSGNFALLCDHGTHIIGASRSAVLERTSSSAAFLNVMGFVQDAQILGHAPKRIFVDIDPGFGQMWQSLGLYDGLTGYDQHVTIGENIGRSDCGLPTCGLKWITTAQPVVMDHWPPIEERRFGAFTSIATWRGAYGPVQSGSKVYGLRVHEFRKFMSLPKATGRRFELALNIHSADESDRLRLQENGWDLVDPRLAAGDPWRYRSFIQSSSAEFMTAKNMYVETKSGWFSDRSICYLASGKAVLAQDTGIRDLYPCGRGLVTFQSMEEAVAGVEEICGNHRTHSLAARELACEYFDSDRVLGRLLHKLGIA